MTCDHSGTYSGQSRYLQQTDELRLVLVCDNCGVERSELGRLNYRLVAHIPEVPKRNPEGRGLGHWAGAGWE